MLGTGLTFAIGVGALSGIVAGVAWLAGGLSRHGFVSTVAHLTLASFILGVAFSGVLALIARGRDLSRVSYRLVSGLGAGAGLVYFVLISTNGIGVWSLANAIGNFVLLIMMGAGGAAATLFVARRATAALSSGDEPSQLGAGEIRFDQSIGAASEVPRRRR
jgi:hypothetical protein